MFVLSFLILLYSLQAAILDLFLLDLLGPGLWLIVTLDGLLLIFLVLSHRPQHASSKAALQWSIYSTLLASKLALYYFKVFPYSISNLTSEKAEEITTLSRSTAFYLLIFVTPVLWTCWTVWASESTLGGMKVTVEVMIFYDTLVHVLLDLVDILSAFTITQFNAVTVEFSRSRPYRANGAVMVVGFLFHALSLPVYSTASAKLVKRTTGEVQNVQQSDVYLTRKYVSLVSVFVLDIPYIIIRMILWRDYGDLIGLQIYIAKNIIDIPLSIFRLNQCRLAEKSAHHEMNRTEQSSVLSMDPKFALYRTSKTVQRGGIVAFEVSTPQTLSSRPSKFAKGVELETPPTVSTIVGPATPPAKQSSWAGIDELRNHHDQRQLPLVGISPLRIAKKVATCGADMGRRSMSSRLDRGLKLSYWKQFRLVMILIFFWTSELFIVTSGLQTSSRWRSGTYQDYEPDHFVFEWRENLKAEIACLTATLCWFLCVIWTAPILDVLFVWCYFFIRLLAFVGSFAAVRDMAVINPQKLAEQLGFSLPDSVPWDKVSLLLVAGGPALSVLSGLYFAQSAFLSRRSTSYVVQPYSRTARKLLASAQAKKESDAGDFESLLERRPKGDEAGWISTASALVYIVAKLNVCPVSYHHLLIGPDMIKSARLTDVLFTNDWNMITITALFRFCIFLLSRSWLLAAIFTLEVILKCVYAISAQTIRLNALEKTTRKATFDLVDSIVRDKNLSNGEKRQRIYRAFRRHQRTCFYLNPGQCIPHP